MSVIATMKSEAVCINVLDAQTRSVLYQLLDETERPLAEKYQEAFDEATLTFPTRRIVVVRVPLSEWWDETAVQLAREEAAAA